MTDQKRFVSRGGEKLDAALDAFSLDVTGWRCADLGSSTGGFTDCLLQRGAKHVHAVDTAYGELAWKLRQDERVTVMERTNALHAQPPVQRVDLVVIDLGWTKQDKVIPTALRWKPGTIITLVKPHYESGQHRMEDQAAEAEATRVIETLPAMGVTVKGSVESPIRGGKGKNREWLVWLGV